MSSAVSSEGGEGETDSEETFKEVCNYLGGEEKELGEHITGCVVGDSKIYPRTQFGRLHPEPMETSLRSTSVTIEKDDVNFVVEKPDVRRKKDTIGGETKNSVVLDGKYFINEDGDVGIVETEHLKSFSG